MQDIKNMTTEELESTWQDAYAELQSRNITKERSENESLIGKCFVYENRYSCSDETWPLYQKVMGVNENGRLITARFEKDTDNKFSFYIDSAASSLLGTELNPLEWKKAVGMLVVEVSMEMGTILDSIGDEN